MSEEVQLPKLDKLTLDGYGLDLDYFLGNAYDDISAASTELPSIIEWVNMQLQSVVEQQVNQKQLIKELEARAFFDLRAGRYEDRGYAGKPTGEAMTHAVALEPSVKDAHREFAKLTSWVRRLNNLQSSLQFKLELIRSTEATRRKLVPNSPDDFDDVDKKSIDD
jgi:hypothetical protein